MIFQKNDVEIQRFDADRQFLEVPYSIPTRTFFEYIPILYPVSMDYETDNLSDEAL